MQQEENTGKAPHKAPSEKERDPEFLDRSTSATLQGSRAPEPAPGVAQKGIAGDESAGLEQPCPE